jgi:HSP20 family protein
MLTRFNDMHQFIGAMDLFRHRMNNLFSDFDRSYPAAAGWMVSEAYPRTNLSDTGDNLQITAEVPGVAKEDVQVKIQGNYLEISGSRKTNIPEGYKAHRNERGAGTFSRSFTLPYEVDAAKVEATLKDGLLNLRLPKAESAKPRQIAIQ